MAKPKEPASPPTSDNAEDNSKLHPVLRGQSMADKLLAAQHQRKEEQEFRIAELEEWKTCVNGLAATPNGRMFLNSFLQYSGMFDPPHLANPSRMVTNTIKGSFYFSWVRPYLQPELRKDIEP